MYSCILNSKIKKHLISSLCNLLSYLKKNLNALTLNSEIKNFKFHVLMYSSFMYSKVYRVAITEISILTKRGNSATCTNSRAGAVASTKYSA